jgi:hypothetical protein
MHRYHFYLIVAIVFGLHSCEEPSVFDIARSTPTELVFQSFFTPNNPIQVTVSKSRSITSTSTATEYILNATVEIYEGDTYMETLSLVEPKSSDNPTLFYTSTEFIPEVNVTYTVRVEAPGYSPISAESKIPLPISLLDKEINDIIYTTNEESKRTHINFDLTVDFIDPIDEINYYHIYLLQQYINYDIFEKDTIPTTSRISPIVLNSANNTNEAVAHVNGGLLLSDQPFNGDGEIIEYTIPISINYEPHKEKLGKLYIELRTIPKEYYDYFSTLSRQVASSGSPLENPVDISDNIVGGKGIFSGYNSSLDSLTIRN